MSRRGGPATRVTRKRGFTCQFSADGKFIYYLKDRLAGGIWRLNLSTKAEEPILPDAASRNWRVLQDGIYILDAKRSSVVTNNGTSPGEALFYTFGKGKLEKLGFVTPKPIRVQGIDVSPDRKWLLYSQAESTGTDLQLVENIPVP